MFSLLLQKFSVQSKPASHPGGAPEPYDLQTHQRVSEDTKPSKKTIFTENIVYYYSQYQTSREKIPDCWITYDSATNNINLCYKSNPDASLSSPQHDHQTTLGVFNTQNDESTLYAPDPHTPLANDTYYDAFVLGVLANYRGLQKQEIDININTINIDFTTTNGADIHVQKLQASWNKIKQQLITQQAQQQQQAAVAAQQQDVAPAPPQPLVAARIVDDIAVDLDDDTMSVATSTTDELQEQASDLYDLNNALTHNNHLLLRQVATLEYELRAYQQKIVQIQAEYADLTTAYEALEQQIRATTPSSLSTTSPTTSESAASSSSSTDDTHDSNESQTRYLRLKEAQNKELLNLATASEKILDLLIGGTTTKDNIEQQETLYAPPAQQQSQKVDALTKELQKLKQICEEQEDKLGCYKEEIHSLKQQLSKTSSSQLQSPVFLKDIISALQTGHNNQQIAQEALAKLQAPQQTPQEDSRSRRHVLQHP